MSIPWDSSVKCTGKLTVCNKLTLGDKVHIFSGALQLFNSLGLPVKMSEAKDEKSANVVMRISKGTATYEYDGNTYSSSKPFDAKRLHGYTMLIGDPVAKAVVFLPSDPQSSAGWIRGKEVVERATSDMMKIVAVHELIHACGLENTDHATDDGVFYFPLAPSGTGKFIVPAKGKDDKPMPPLRISQSTVCKVASLWK